MSGKFKLKHKDVKPNLKEKRLMREAKNLFSALSTWI